MRNRFSRWLNKRGVILDHFGLLAPYYDRVIKLKMEQVWIEMLELPCNGLMLDAGGGTGRVAQMLVGQVDQLILADESMGMLKQAKKKDQVIPLQSQTEALAFPSSVFDRILMVDALHHVAHQRETARELWRVLKPGGILLIEEPDIKQPSVKWLALGEKLLLMRSHFLSASEISEMFPKTEAEIKIHTSDFNVWIAVKRKII
jgi:demethylmenaquinone methyltransferase/2-methoxy-6-polyprenyl-1,4-benzoquinol methylase